MSIVKIRLVLLIVGLISEVSLHSYSFIFLFKPFRSVVMILHQRQLKVMPFDPIHSISCHHWQYR